MDLDAKKFKSLGNLQGRLVRGVKHGSFNTKSACKIFVTTDSSSDTAPVKEYLLEASVAKNTVTGTATFTGGSARISAAGKSSFSGVKKGDVIRRASELTYYAVSNVSSDGRTVTLKTPFATGAQGVPITCQFVARKTSAGSAVVTVVENSELSPGSFAYNHTKGAWVPSSVADRSVTRALDGVAADGVTLHCLGRDASPLPDVASTGVVSAFKVTAPAGHDSASLPLPAVPYPADESGVVVLESPAGSSSYSLLSRDEYLIDYTGSPVPSLDQPLFLKRSSARLLRTKKEQAYTDITSSYGGQWSVQDSRVRHTSMLFGSEEVSIGDASNPAYVSEDMTLTAADLLAGRRALLRTPIGKIVLNVAEGPAQSDGLDFIVVDGVLIWKGYGLEAEAYEGLALRLYYQSSGEPRLLYPYMDYLVEPRSGTITTVNQQAGAIFSVQYIVLTSKDIGNKMVQLASAPVGPVALNVTNGSSARPGHDFYVKGNRIHWDGMGLDVEAMQPGTTLRASYQSGSGEYPVEYMFQDVEAFWSGVSVYRSKKDPFSINMSSRDEWGSRLLRGTDWNLNTTNGSFALLGAVAEDDTTLFEYLGNGIELVTEVLDPSVSPAGTVTDKLRLRYSPVVPGTVTVYATGAGPKELLSDGVHYNMAPGTGSITVLRPLVKGVLWHVSYLPAIAYYYAVKGKPPVGASTEIHAILEPARASSTTSIVVSNKGAAQLSVPSLKVRLASGEALPLTGVKFDASSSRLTFSECKALTAGQVVTLDYTFTARALPFMPAVQLPCHVAKGADLVHIDGSRVGNSFVPGRLVGLASSGSTAYELFSIKNVLNPSGVNICLQLSGHLSETMQSPSVLVTSKEVAFSQIEGMLIEPYSAGQGFLLANGRQDYSILPGMVMKVHRSVSGAEELYRVLSCTYDADTTMSTISVSPATRTAGIVDNENTTVSFSSSPVYMEGDTSIITKYPLLQEGFPIWKLEYAVDNGGYATLQVNKASAVLKEYLPEGTVEHKVMMDSSATVDDLAQSLAACGGGKRFSLKWLYPKGSGVLQSSLVRTGCEQPLPYEVLSLPQLRRKTAVDGYFKPLKHGSFAGDGDYRTLGRHIILDRPMAIGDQYAISYVGLDNLAVYRGRSLQVTSRRVVPIPESTKYRVSYEYLHQDQLYLQTLTEADFLEEVASPLVDSVESAREGQSPFGCLSLPASPEASPAVGGFQDTMFQLRDELLKYDLYKKVHDFYSGRYLQFAEEYSAITGVRPCRSITSCDQQSPEYSLRGAKELDLYATFGQAPFFPEGYEDPTPLPDGRFSGKYLSFGSANFFNFKNDKGVLEGVMLSRGGGFLSRGLSAGDSLKAECSPAYLTIARIMSEEELRFTTKVPWKGDSGYRLKDGVFKQKVRPVFSWMGSPTYKEVPKSGSRYWVKSNSVLPPVSQDGSPFATVYSSIGEPFPLSEDPSCSNVLCLETSRDGGQTWAKFEIDLSFLEPPYTADRVAHAISAGARQAPPTDPETEEVVQGLSDLLEVNSVSRLLSAGVPVEKTLSGEWPLALPDKEGFHGVAKALSFRARDSVTWLRFIEPTSAEDGDVLNSGASSLGLPVNEVIMGATDYWSASLSFSRELEMRSKELDAYKRMLEAFDCTDRGEPLVHTGPATLLLRAASEENSAAMRSLGKAEQAASAISLEDEGTDAMQASSAEAMAAKSLYGGHIAACALTNVEDTAVLETLKEPGVATRYLATIERVVVDEESANSSAVQSFLSEGEPSILLPAQEGQRVLIGTATGQTVCGVSSEALSELGGKSYLFAADAPEDLKVVHVRPVTEVFSSSVSLSSNQVLISYRLTNESPEKSFSVSINYCPTLNDLVKAINKEVSGVLVATLNRGPLTLEDFSLLGGTPSSRVIPMDPVGAPAYLSIHGRPYSTAGHLRVRIKPSIKVALAETAASLTSSPDGILVTLKDGRLFIVPVLPADTFLSFKARVVEALGTHASVEMAGEVPEMDPCTGFVSSPELTGEAMLYPSVSGNLEYGVLSDRRLLERLKLVQDRVSAVRGYLAAYPPRKKQIIASVGPSGEDLSAKQHEWLCLLVDKEIGPCTKIPQLKKRILSSKLYKDYIQRVS